MVLKIETNINTNTTSTVTSVAINSTTAVTLCAVNFNRLFFHADNDDNAIGFWLRLYPAAQDTIKHGIFVSGKNGANPFWEMPTQDKYTGEISAISVSGNHTAYITEY